MKNWVLAAVILFMMQGADAREHWGPPPVCPQPKVDCCPKPKTCKPRCQTKSCQPKCQTKSCQSNSCESKCKKPSKPCSCEPCCCITPCKPILNPAYNQNSAIDVCCGWNMWVDASFTYWEAMEDNLEVGISVPSANTVTASGFTDGSVIGMEYEYKPGFKIGLGITSNYDHWDFYMQYIWFRSKVDTSESVSSGEGIVPIAGNPFVHNSGIYNNVSSSWKADLDTVDGRMGRCYYVGRKLTFHPYCGIRATWIRQDWDSVFHNVNIASPATTVTTHQKLNSWGLGPEIGLDTHWNFCYGLRIFGNAEADLLFTRYTNYKVDDANLVAARFFEATESDNDTLRAHFNLELGLGWGTYLYCNKYYLDLSAGYEFQIFCDQNMFREYQNQNGFSSTYGGNLYLHGLTIQAMFEF